MKRLFTNGFIYKVIKYADNSCIAEAFTLDYGKIKLFAPKAFSKRGGVLRLAPGQLDFLQKDTSDLDKLYSFTANPDYLFFIDEPGISMRLSLFFDMLDKLLPLDEPHPVLFNTIMKVDLENARKLTLFIIYALLKNSGNMLDIYNCSNCEKEILEKSYLANDSVLCEACVEAHPKDELFLIDSDVNLIMHALRSKELYKNLQINLKQEIAALEVFVRHVEKVVGVKLKSFTSYKELIRKL